MVKVFETGLFLRKFNVAVVSWLGASWKFCRSRFGLQSYGKNGSRFE